MQIPNKKISNEIEGQRDIGEKLALFHLKSEIELLKLTASINEEKYKRIDAAMHREINK